MPEHVRSRRAPSAVLHHRELVTLVHERFARRAPPRRAFRLVRRPFDVRPSQLGERAAFGARALEDATVESLVGGKDARRILVHGRATHHDLAVAVGKRPPLGERDGIALAANVDLKGVHLVQKQHLRRAGTKVARRARRYEREAPAPEMTAEQRVPSRVVHEQR